MDYYSRVAILLFMASMFLIHVADDQPSLILGMVLSIISSIAFLLLSDE